MRKRNMLTILKEAAEGEYVNTNESIEYDGYDDGNVTDDDLNQLQNDIIDSYDNIEEVEDEDLEYTEEMVVVMAPASGGYLVEYDNLAKLMESANCDAYAAMQKISECNNIPLDEMKLVVESDECIASILQEKAVSRKAKKKKSSAMKSSSVFLKDVMNKGITVVKKKSKKNKKKK